MAKNGKPLKLLKPGKPRQDHIDGSDFNVSRKTWNPDLALLEQELERANRRNTRKERKRKKSG
jgi:hypothetical protein